MSLGSIPERLRCVVSHGGGYAYRLAPANGPLTEASFGNIPLEFVGQQMLRWGGGTAKGGKQLSFNGTYATGDKAIIYLSSTSLGFCGFYVISTEQKMTMNRWSRLGRCGLRYQSR